MGKDKENCTDLHSDGNSDYNAGAVLSGSSGDSLFFPCGSLDFVINVSDLYAGIES